MINSGKILLNIRDLRKSTGNKYIYVLIPEPHKDGAWHFHGLVGGFVWNDLLKFEKGKHPDKLVNSGFRYDRKILDRFGFNSFGKIRSKTAVSKYVTKYITKDIMISNLGLNSHIFYASQKLNKAELVFEGNSTNILTKIDFSNDFCAMSWIKKSEVNKLIDRLY